MSQRLRTLWEELFADEAQGRSMRTVATALRARRRKRMARRLVACAAMIGSLVAGWWLWRGSEVEQVQPEATGRGIELVQAAGPSNPEFTQQPDEPVVAVKYLSDSEMLQQLKGYPVALVGQPGSRRLVYLGDSPEERAVFTQTVSTAMARQCPLATRVDFALLDCTGCHGQ